MREDIADVESPRSFDDVLQASDAAMNLPPFVDEDWSRRNVESSARFSHRRRQLSRLGLGKSLGRVPGLIEGERGARW